MTRIVIPLVAVLGLAAAAIAQPPLQPGEVRPPSNPNVRFDEKRGEPVPLGLVFRDEAGNPIALKDCLLPGKPAILVMAYYRCPMLCTEVLNDLVDAMKGMPLTAGKDYTVITVSFDPKETPGQAAEKKRSYLAEYGRAGAESGWRFLTCTTGKDGEKAVKELADAIGFRYVFDKAFKEYDHPSGLVVLTPDGRVSQYLYGLRYGDKEYPTKGDPTRKTTLRLMLVEASDGQIGSILDQIWTTCYRFDHIEQRYSLNIMLAVRVGGVLTVLALAAAVVYFLRRERRKGPAAAGPEPELAAAGADRPTGVQS